MSGRYVGRVCTDCGSAYVAEQVDGPDAGDTVRGCACDD